MCPKLGLSFPTHPQHRWQRLSLSPGFWAGPLATGPEHGLPGAWSPGLPASVLGPSLAGLFPPGLGLAFSPLAYEWIPGKGSGPPAVTGLTHQHTVSRGLSASRRGPHKNQGCRANPCCLSWALTSPPGASVFAWACRCPAVTQCRQPRDPHCSAAGRRRAPRGIHHELSSP